MVGKQRTNPMLEDELWRCQGLADCIIAMIGLPRLLLGISLVKAEHQLTWMYARRLCMAELIPRT